MYWFEPRDSGIRAYHSLPCSVKRWQLVVSGGQGFDVTESASSSSGQTVGRESVDCRGRFSSASLSSILPHPEL